NAAPETTRNRTREHRTDHLSMPLHGGKKRKAENKENGETNTNPFRKNSEWHSSLRHLTMRSRSWCGMAIWPIEKGRPEFTRSYFFGAESTIRRSTQH